MFSRCIPANTAQPSRIMSTLKTIALVAAAAATALATSCATTRGFGQDLQKVGNNLENQAESTGGTVPPNSTTTTRTTRTSTVVVPPPAPSYY